MHRNLGQINHVTMHQNLNHNEPDAKNRVSMVRTYIDLYVENNTL